MHNHHLLEVMPELFSRSEMITLHFADITSHDKDKDIQAYMQQQEAIGHDPRDAAHRQAFNQQAISRTGARYLIGRYAEDRCDMLKGSHMEAEGRTFHMAIDIFAKEQEPVFAPCNGEIIVSGYEPGLHNYGHYLIMRPADPALPYIFFGHLTSDKRAVGHVRAGDRIARLGSFENLENGGWSIHLHLQLLTEMPPTGKTPIGYSSLQSLNENMQRFPDPCIIFPDWQINH